MSSSSEKMLFSDLFLRRLCHARDLLAELDEGAPSVREVARSCQLSPFQFIRQFDAVFGPTPHRFRTQLRIERAKVLLAADHPSVTDVCLGVGFTSLGSFSALFSQRVGASPTSYRRRLRRVYAAPDARARALTPGCFGLLACLPLTSFESHDIKAECARSKKSGVAFVQEPTEVGPVIIAVFADTCGNLIQLHQPTA
jgi:AraC-like DNA-binding protein